jgi:hypothetical protein
VEVVVEEEEMGVWSSQAGHLRALHKTAACTAGTRLECLFGLVITWQVSLDKTHNKK